MIDSRPAAPPTIPADERSTVLARALRLECLTVGWNLIEGGVGVASAVAAGSVALLGFGIDSFVECASGLVLIWRLIAEGKAADHEAIERIDRTAHRLVVGGGARKSRTRS